MQSHQWIIMLVLYIIQHMYLVIFRPELQVLYQALPYPMILGQYIHLLQYQVQPVIQASILVTITQSFRPVVSTVKYDTIDIFQTHKIIIKELFSKMNRND